MFSFFRRKKKALFIPIFFISVTLILALEGWALPITRNISYHFLLFIPFFLYIANWNNASIFRVPQRLFFFIITFITIIFATTLFSVHIQRSFEYRMLYVSIFLIGLFVYNHQEEFKDYFQRFITYTSIVTLYLAALIYTLTYFNIETPLWDHAYQFVKPVEYVGHYTFGAFILIPFVYISVYTFQHTTIPRLIASAMLLAALLLSNLRAAYVSVAVTVTAIMIINTRSKRIFNSIPFIFIASSIIFFFIASGRDIHSSLFVPRGEDGLPLNSKQSKIESLEIRIELIKQSLQSISQHPLTGIGSDNFIYASRKLANSSRTVLHTSHNIFLDIGVENGIIALAFFIAIMVLLFSPLRRLRVMEPKDQRILALSVALGTLFLFSHYHKSYFLLLFLFLTVFLLYREKRELLYSTHFFGIAAGALAVINVIIITSQILYSAGKYDNVLRLYPIHLEGRQAKISKLYRENKTEKMKQQMTVLLRLYPNEPYIHASMGDMYRLLNDHEKAVSFYEKALSLYPQEINNLQVLYEILTEFRGEDYARAYTADYIEKNGLIANNPATWDTVVFKKWCEYNKISYTND